MSNISIAMTTYRAVKHIGQQLESFVAQTRQPDELVVSDDGSTDGTAEVVERFAASAPFPVRYLRNQHRLGVTGNFERAVVATTGDIVFMSDDDDTWHPDKLAIVESVFAADPTAMAVLNDQEIADANGRGTGRTVLGNVRRLGYGDDHFGTGACTALRREILSILLPFPPDVPYDQWTNVLPYNLGVRRLIDRPLQLYRRHETNATHSLLARPNAGFVGMIAANTGDRANLYRGQLEFLEIQRERLQARRAEVDGLGLASARNDALDAIAQEEADLIARMHAISRGAFVRPFVVARHLAAGRYRRFQGWRSAAKDILRP